MPQRRQTRQRQLVLQAVQAHRDHPSVQSICQTVHQSDPGISQATVYRNLALLAQEGKVLHIKVPGADRFDLRADPHDHVLCLCCGQVVDASTAYDPAQDVAVARETGFCIRRHQTLFEGICPCCQRLQGHST